MYPVHLLILEFAQEENADELYAQIRDYFSGDPDLNSIADSYEQGQFDDSKFCEQVLNYLKTIGYNG